MRTVLIAGAVALSVFAVGCDDDAAKSTPAQTAPPAQPAPAPQGKSMEDQAKDVVAEGKQAIQSAATEVKQTAQAVAEQAKPKIEAATTQLKQEVGQASQAIGDKVKQLTNNTTTASAPATAESFDYQQKLEEAMTYLKEHKVDLADKTLAQVESRKASIPASFHPRIDSVRKMIDTAKQARNTGISLPKF